MARVGAPAGAKAETSEAPGSMKERRQARKRRSGPGRASITGPPRSQLPQLLRAVRDARWFM